MEEEKKTPPLISICDPSKVKDKSIRIQGQYSSKQELCNEMFNLDSTFLNQSLYSTHITRYPKEKDAPYFNRLKNSFANNYYSTAVTSQSGIILDKYELDGAITFDYESGEYILKADVPVNFKEWCKDMTGTGESFLTLISNLSVSTWKEGAAPWIIDYTIYNSDSLVTYKDFKELNPRPYVKLIAPEDILETVKDENNSLVRLRFKKDFYGKDDRLITYIYVYDVEKDREENPLAVFTYSDEEKTSEFKLIDIDELPYGILADSTIIHPIKSCPLLGDPPFIELAILQRLYLNKVGEWSYTTSIAMIPFLVFKGFNTFFENNPENTMDYGPAIALLAPLDSDISYVEISGHSLQAGKDSVDFFKEQCETAGGLALEKSLATTVVVSQAPTNRLYNRFLENLTYNLNKIMDCMCIRHGLKPPTSRISFTKKNVAEVTDPTTPFVESTKSKIGE